MNKFMISVTKQAINMILWHIKKDSISFVSRTNLRTMKPSTSMSILATSITTLSMQKMVSSSLPFFSLHMSYKLLICPRVIVVHKICIFYPRGSWPHVRAIMVILQRVFFIGTNYNRCSKRLVVTAAVALTSLKAIQ